ncbi:MAG: glycosyltransferase family 1 protein, partial [Paracoccaceae bacterium]
ADLRRLSLTRCRAAGLATMLGKQVPAGTAYLNVGHSNLSAPVLAALRRVPGARISVLIHDTIPLDFPQYSGAGIPDAFRDKLRAVGEHADLVICNSEVTHRDAARHMAEMGRVPPMTVAHLGVELPEPDPRGLPEGLDLSRPYFLTVGTIEPRKNHALLLDVWEGFHNDLPEDKIPRLFIAGTRGWRNEDVFRRLDSAPFMGRNVVELADLSDAALAALTQGATALLFPSHAEGYGLPPLEAAALGTPVIASDLPVHAEVLGDFAVYLSGRDAYSWRNKILGMTRGRGQTGKAAPQSGQGPALPTWDAHFETVLALT